MKSNNNTGIAILIAGGVIYYFADAFVDEWAVKAACKGIGTLIGIYGLIKKAAPGPFKRKLDNFLRRIIFLEPILPKPDLPRSNRPGSDPTKFKSNLLDYTLKVIKERRGEIMNSNIFRLNFRSEPKYRQGTGSGSNRSPNWKGNPTGFTVIVGNSGSGKSLELVRRMEYVYKDLDAIRSRSGTLKDERLPLYVELKGLNEDFSPEGIAEYTQRSARSLRAGAFNKDDIEQLILDNKAIFFFDGLDEVRDRKTCLEAILGLAGGSGVHFTCGIEVYEELKDANAIPIDNEPAEFPFAALTKMEIDEIITESILDPASKAEIRLLIDTRENLQENLSSPITLNLFLSGYQRLSLEERNEFFDADGGLKSIGVLWRNYEDYIISKMPKDLDFLKMRTYLVWLAKEKGTDAFYVESIQPDWLRKVDKNGEVQPARNLQKLYYTLTRVIASIIVGLAISCIISVPGAFLFNSILAGLIVAAMAGIYKSGFNYSGKRATVVNILFYFWMVVALVAFCGFYQGFSVPRSSSVVPSPAFSSTETWPGILLGLAMSTILSYRIILEKQKKQYILPVEFFRFDWGHAVRYGLSWGAICACVVGIVAVAAERRSGGNLFIDQWLIPQLKDLSRYFRGKELAPSEVLPGVFFYGFTVAFIVISAIVITLAGRYNDPEGMVKKEYFNFAIIRSLREAGIHAMQAAIVAGALYLGVRLLIHQGDWLHMGLISSGIFLLAFLWFGGMEALNHGILRIMLFSRRITPLKLNKWVRYNRDMGLLRPTGYQLSFNHSTLANYYQRYPMKENPRIQVKRKFVDVPVLWTIVGLLVVLLTLPFVLRFALGLYWKSPYSGIVVSSKDVRRLNDSTYVLQKPGKVTLRAKGWMDVGTFVGLVRPNGTRHGFMGMPLKAAYNLPYLDSFRHAALLCRWDTGQGWSPYLYASMSKPLWVRRGAGLQVVVNDKEWQNNWGYYTLELHYCDTCK
jgi:hypothetical protein